MILVFIELDGGSPEGLVRVLVDPGDEAGVFDGVEQADVERGLAAVTEGELERAGLDEVLFLGGPNEGVLLDVEATVEVREVEGLVEVIDGERLVDDKVGGAGVKDDESLFFWGGKPTWIVPDQDKSWSREGLLEVRFCLLAQSKSTTFKCWPVLL